MVILFRGATVISYRSLLEHSLPRIMRTTIPHPRQRTRHRLVLLKSQIESTNIEKITKARVMTAEAMVVAMSALRGMIPQRAPVLAETVTEVPVRTGAGKKTVIPEATRKAALERRCKPLVSRMPWRLHRAHLISNITPLYQAMRLSA